MRPHEIAITLLVALTANVLAMPTNSSAQAREPRAGDLLGALWPSDVACSARLSPPASGSTANTLVCGPKTLTCTLEGVGELAPNASVERVLLCQGDAGNRVVVADASGAIVNDFGDPDIFGDEPIKVVDFVGGPYAQLLMQFGGDAGTVSIVAWDDSANRFRLAFQMYADYLVLTTDITQPGSSVTIDTCTDTWRWNANTRVFAVAARRRGRMPPACRHDGDDVM